MRIVHAARWAVVLSLMAPGIGPAPRESERAALAMGAHHWACPPCSGGCDDLIFEHPGTCPVCGKALVEESMAAH